MWYHSWGQVNPTWVQSIYDLLAGRYLLAAAHIDAFAKALPTDGGPFDPEALDEVQEVFTRSFDVQSITTLGVGYVMFGDDYKRGEMLVNLNRELRDAGIDPGTELPDHLPNVLRLISRWEDRELAAEFVEEILHPALERMIAEFGTRHMEARNGLYKKHFKTLIVSSAERDLSRGVGGYPGDPSSRLQSLRMEAARTGQRILGQPRTRARDRGK